MADKHAIQIDERHIIQFEPEDRERVRAWFDAAEYKMDMHRRDYALARRLGLRP